MPDCRNTVKEDKALLLLRYTGLYVHALLLSLFHTQTLTRGLKDASVGIKVLPLAKLKPLITNWESIKEQRGDKRDRCKKVTFVFSDLGRFTQCCWQNG